ncbi:hypothetical protein ACFXK0_04160 [Nocardia sp. NPDC059177]|uniref:hypothetical protein n=1 Tax=Nocardia sp. NPDC059177 TaxID=3346759 RepID=UPI0036B83194
MMRYQLRYIRMHFRARTGIAGGFIVREETLACATRKHEIRAHSPAAGTVRSGCARRRLEHSTRNPKALRRNVFPARQALPASEEGTRMKTLGMVAAGITVTTVTMLGTGSAGADFTDPVEFSDTIENVEEPGFTDYAIDVDHPRSCLVVQNHRGGDVRLRLNYPASSGQWTFRRNQTGVLYHRDKVVRSPSGRWSVRANPPVDAKWIYDANMNTGKGCNGSWLLTLN